MPMSNAEINRLGERLRASALVGDDDLALLQDLRREYESAMYDIQTKLAAELGPRSVTTSRLKTVQTLVGKLGREPRAGGLTASALAWRADRAELGLGR
jgi:hypothetical protein